mgnify:CR=1 FL=1
MLDGRSPRDPAALIIPGAVWQPGAWTAARCELWRQADPDTRARLERWVMAEHDRGLCYRAQLPEETRPARPARD